MQIDVRGRVRNTQVASTKPLLPLFEAIVNSIQSLELSGRADGRIDVRVERERTLQDALGQDDENYLGDVTGFEIIDDGVGFDDDNFTSFCTADSRFKEARGGKGLGRFTWLKVFEDVSIDSVYRTTTDTRRRQFTFELSPDGIGKLLDEAVASPPTTSTVVRLRHYKRPYREHCPKRLETIGLHVLQHCMAFYVHRRAPRIVLQDENHHLELNELFRLHYPAASQVATVAIKDRPFEIVHVRLYRQLRGEQHRLHFCADGREVASVRLAQDIPNLAAKLVDEEGNEFLWTTYLSGGFLDERVTPERTRFEIPAEASPMFPDEISMADLREAAVLSVRSQLAPMLAPIEEGKLREIERFVDSEAPEYRVVFSRRPDALAAIAPGLPKERLEMELHRIKYELERETRSDLQQLLRSDNPQLEQIQRRLVDENEIGKADLAKYVFHRRVVLDLLERALERGEDGGYSLESAVHSLVFPMNVTSDDVPFEQQNLWVLDDALAFHAYLASDKSLAKTPTGSVSKLRPDIVVWNRAHALTSERESISSVAIIEFKRPMRGRYDDDDDPISQVLAYVREIRSGKAIDRRGRPIPYRAGMVFYARIVADLTTKLRTLADNAAMVELADGEGYVTFNVKLGTSIEIISYDKMLRDARKRNRAFFEKLGIAHTSVLP